MPRFIEPEKCDTCGHYKAKNDDFVIISLYSLRSSKHWVTFDLYLPYTPPTHSLFTNIELGLQRLFKDRGSKSRCLVVVDDWFVAKWDGERLSYLDGTRDI